MKWFKRSKQTKAKEEEKKPKTSRLKGWYSRSKQKRIEKKKKDQENRESEFTKIFASIFTFIAMALAMSIVPIFSNPLPILIAVLVAFLTFRDPRFGMPIGGAIIGFGLMYHLSLKPFYFLSFLGDTQIRVAVLVVWMTLLIISPIIFHRYKSALAIDFGLLAAASLFSTSTYFLAIPLILTSAVFFKKQVALTIVYYVLITVPLQIVQYFIYTVTPIKRSDWWLTPGSSPPIFVPLNKILADLGSSMSQFRLYDASQVVYAITGQLTWNPNFGGRTLTEALNQYRDSTPGILMFVVIVAGLSLALIFFARLLVSQGSGSFFDKIIPCFIATCAAAFFFIFLSALQYGLAFSADVSGATMIFGILATLLFTFPTAFMNNAPKQTATSSDIAERTKALMDRVQIFQGQLNNVKENIPVAIASPEGKLLIVKDSLEDTLEKLSRHFYESAELNKKFQELKKSGTDLDDLELELGKILSEYQIFVNCQFSDWIGKLKETGLNVTSKVDPSFQNEMTLDARIETIKKILNDGRALAKEVVNVVLPIYSVIRPLYDPSLPEKSRTIEFAIQKLEQKEAPWIAIEALDSSLNNWKKQYGAEISKSIYYLKQSLMPIINLPSQTISLAPIIGDKMPTLLADSKKAASLKEASDKKRLDVLSLLTIRELLDATLDISKEVFSILNEALKEQENSIEEMLPTSNYLWEKNITLKERMAQAMDVLSNSKAKMNDAMENLPKFVNYIDECVQTLTLYNERKEFLLNYPVAKLVIEEQLKQKSSLVIQDLPFQTKYSAEYLKVFYLQNYTEFDFDKINTILTRKS